MRKVSSILKKTVYFVLVAALLASSLSMGVFAAINDYAGPQILGVSLNDTRSVITLQFNREIEAAVSSLKGRVKISKDGASLEALPSATNITISGFRMQISLTAPLETGNNYIQILANTLVSQSIDLETSLFDARGPALADTNPVTVSSSAKKVTIKFKSAIKGYPNDESLKNGYISLARSGSSFNEAIPKDNIEINGSKGEIEITLDEPLTGTRNRFKIAAGKVQTSTTGNINLNDIITSYISVTGSSSNIDPNDPDDEYVFPQIKSTTISSDLRTVTINFTDRIKNAFATGVSASLAQTFLKSYVSVSRGSLNNFELLSGADSISVGSNYVSIVFNTPLTDKNNYIKFHEGSLTDNNNIALPQDLITDSVTAGTTAGTSPEYASVALSGNNKIIVYFSMPVIKNSSLSQTQLRSSISISRNGGSYKTLTTYDTVSFSGSTMTITLDTPITGTKNRVKILANTVTSKVGVPLSNVVTTDYISYNSNNDSYDYYVPEYSNVTYDSTNHRIRIYFENDIKVTSVSDLHDSISISRNGSSYKALSSNDVVSVSPSNAISILLDEPLPGGKNAVRIAKGTLADFDSGYVLNEAVTTEYININSTGSDEDETSNGTTTSGSTQYNGDVEATLSEDFYTVTLKFNQTVSNNLSTLEDLKERIQISRDGRFSSLSENDYIRINEVSNELLIVLAEPADEYFSQIKILPSSLRNASGTTLSNTIITLPLGEASGSARIYVNDFAVSSSVSAETSSTAIVATLSDTSGLHLSSSAELLVKLPQERNSATLNLSKNVVDSLKNYNASVALSFGNATYYIPASNISTLASGDTFSITVNTTSAASTNLSKASTANSFEVEASAVDMSASVIAASGSKTKVTHKAFAKKRFMVEDIADKNFFTVVRTEKSGTVVPVPTNTDTTRGVAYLTAETLEDGDYAAVSATHTFTNTPSWVTGPANTLGSKLILANASGSDLNANQAIARSETVTIMTKTLGVFGDASGASPFFDMIPTDSYFNAVMSAVSQSLISGYPDGTFKPNGKLTRAEAMTIVARAMRFLDGKDVSESAEMSDAEATAILAKFTDAGTVDSWAKKDIAECVQAGVVNGDNNGRLNPKANVTRAELIQLMYNLLSRKSLL